MSAAVRLKHRKSLDKKREAFKKASETRPYNGCWWASNVTYGKRKPIEYD